MQQFTCKLEKYSKIISKQILPVEFSKIPKDCLQEHETCSSDRSMYVRI